MEYALNDETVGAYLKDVSDRLSTHGIRINDYLGYTDVLDVGCGPGALVQRLQDCGINAYGIDCDDYGQLKANFIKTDASKIPFEDRSFGFVFSRGVFEIYNFLRREEMKWAKFPTREHKRTPEQFIEDTLREIHRVLLPTGIYYCDEFSFNKEVEFASIGKFNICASQGNEFVILKNK